MLKQEDWDLEELKTLPRLNSSLKLKFPDPPLFPDQHQNVSLSSREVSLKCIHPINKHKQPLT